MSCPKSTLKVALQFYTAMRNEKKIEQQRKGMPKWPPRRPTKIGSWDSIVWMVIFTAVLVCCTAVTAAIYAWQLGIIRGQLDEMRGSSAQTERLLGLQEQQLGELRKQASNTHDLAVAAGGQAAASQKLATSSKIQADTTRQQLVLSQRPWVGVDLERQPMISIEREPGRTYWLPYYKNPAIRQR